MHQKVETGKFVTFLDLFFKRCPCGETTIFGFYQQFKWQVIRKTAYATYAKPIGLKCEKCEMPVLYDNEYLFSPEVKND